jgi:hypothetical protein
MATSASVAIGRTLQVSPPPSGVGLREDGCWSAADVPAFFLYRASMAAASLAQGCCYGKQLHGLMDACVLHADNVPIVENAVARFAEFAKAVFGKMKRHVVWRIAT